MIKCLLEAFVVNKEILEYDILNYRIKNYTKTQEFFDKWNMKFFLPNGVFISCPVTIDYLQFNKEPLKEINLEHHEIAEI